MATTHRYTGTISKQSPFTTASLAKIALLFAGVYAVLYIGIQVVKANMSYVTPPPVDSWTTTVAE